MTHESFRAFDAGTCKCDECKQAKKDQRAMNNSKQAILNALSAFANQRPGIEPGNYGSWRDYRNEAAGVTRDLAHFRVLSGAVWASNSITAEAILKEAQSGGRLELNVGIGADIDVEYTTGSYFPTEYRKAACRLLASVLWAHVREHCMPPGSTQGADDGATLLYRNNVGKGHVSAGDWLRAHFKKQFGKGLADRYFL